MKKNKELTEETKCTCGCDSECTCDENCDCGCQEGKECTCDCNCNDKCDCGCELPPIEEKLILVGTKDEKETKKAIKYLDKKEIDYTFLDLEDGKKEGYLNLTEKIQVPTLLLVQTIIGGIASGVEEIKEAFEEE